MGVARELTNQRFGRLIVIKDSGIRKNSHIVWECLCDCGQTTYVQVGDLVNQNTQSCGCLRKEIVSANKYIHGHARTSINSESKTYSSWCSMKERCNNKDREDYKYYGGRGITICERWLNSFENFLADMGERPKDLTLDRINNDGNYEPGNCRWTTRKVQTENRRKSSRQYNRRN